MSAPGDEEVVWSVDWGSLPAAESLPAEPDAPASIPQHAPNPAPIAATVQAAQPLPPPLPPAPASGTQPTFLASIAAQPAKSLVRGQRMKLTDIGLSSDFEIAIRVGASNGLVVDVTCLGLDEKDRLADE